MDCSLSGLAGVGQVEQEIRELKSLLRQLAQQNSNAGGSQGVTTRSVSHERSKLFASMQQTFQLMENKHDELIEYRQKQKELADEFKHARHQMIAIEQKLSHWKETSKLANGISKYAVEMDPDTEETPSKRRRV